MARLIAVLMFFIGLLTQPLLAVENASWGSVKAGFSSAPAGKLVVTKEKVGGKREVRSDLVIYVDKAFSSRYVVEGVVGFPFAKYTLDATKSGEDIFVTSLGLMLTISQPGTAGELVNCQLWDSLDRWSDGDYPLTLPPNSVATLPESFISGDVVIFNLDRGLVIKRGTIKTVTLKSDVQYNAKAWPGATFSWGIKNSGRGMSVQGILSGKEFVPKIIESIGQPMILRQQGELEVSLDPSSPPFNLVEAGSLNVPVATLRFISLYEPIILRQIGFRSDAPDANIYTNPCAIMRFTLWHEHEQVGEGLFANGNSTFVTLSREVIIPADSQELLTVKVDISSIGDGYCAKSGDAITIGYDGEHPDDTWGVGQYSGSRIVSGSDLSSVSYGIRIESSLDLEELINELNALEQQVSLDTTLSPEQLAALKMQAHLLRSWLHMK